MMLIRHALLAATHPAGAFGRKHRALARRIHKRETDYLKFAHNPAISFTNNSDEQESRRPHPADQPKPLTARLPLTSYGEGSLQVVR